MHYIITLILAMFAATAGAQTVNLAPSLDGYQNGTRMWPVDAVKAKRL